MHAQMTERPKPLPRRRDYPQTEATIRAAREYQEIERAKATRDCGIVFDADGVPHVKDVDVSH